MTGFGRQGPSSRAVRMKPGPSHVALTRDRWKIAPRVGNVLVREGQESGFTWIMAGTVRFER
jgi:hypothetical protein